MPVVEDPRLARWESRADIPLCIAAVLYLFAYAVPILVTDLPVGWWRLLNRLNNAIWLYFLVDYVARVVVAKQHARYVLTHLFDLAIVILPYFQPLRLLRLLVLLRVLNRRVGASLRSRLGLYMALASVLVVFIAALAVYDVERYAADSGLGNFADALWWSLVTVTTVGYGDIAPVTTTGRFVAVLLMLFGIGLLSTLIGTLASWLFESIEEDEATHTPPNPELAHLRAEIQALREEVRALGAQQQATKRS